MLGDNVFIGDAIDDTGAVGAVVRFDVDGLDRSVKAHVAERDVANAIDQWIGRHGANSATKTIRHFNVIHKHVLSAVGQSVARVECLDADGVVEVLDAAVTDGDVAPGHIDAIRVHRVRGYTSRKNTAASIVTIGASGCQQPSRFEKGLLLHIHMHGDIVHKHIDALNKIHVVHGRVAEGPVSDHHIYTLRH